MYSFWQYELCDVFIELIKPVMSGGDAPSQQATRETLCTCLEQGLRSAPPCCLVPSLCPFAVAFRQPRLLGLVRLVAGHLVNLAWYSDHHCMTMCNFATPCKGCIVSMIGALSSENPHREASSKTFNAWQYDCCHIGVICVSYVSGESGSRAHALLCTLLQQ